MSRPSYLSHQTGMGYSYYPVPAPTPPSFVASHASYSGFLSLQDTARIHLACAGRGLFDAFRWDIVFRLVSSDSEIRANVLKSLLLNTLSLAFIYALDLLLFPLTSQGERWLHRNVGWAYQVLWLLPVVGVSLYLNSTWCTLIAKRAFTLQHGPRAGAYTPAPYAGLLNALTRSAYSGTMVLSSLLVSFAVGRVPRAGPIAAFVFLCWVDAYYCFEHVWIARGLSLSQRVRHLEERWAYYFAFGLPSAALCMWGSSLANAALFALVFPAYIIMAMHAHPVPLDPYKLAHSSFSSSADGMDACTPHPHVPIRLPIFAPVLWLNDMFVRALSWTGSSPPPDFSASTSGYGYGYSYGSWKSEQFRTESAESIEEGGRVAVELGPVSGVGTGMGVDTGRTRMRVGIGASRRKFD